MTSTTATVLFGISSAALCFFVVYGKKHQQVARSHTFIEELLRPLNFPVTRRDNKDISCAQSAIKNEILRITGGKSCHFTTEQVNHLHSFARGVWEVATGLTKLMTLERADHTMKEPESQSILIIGTS
jgi:hypothetical protein